MNAKIKKWISMAALAVCLLMMFSACAPTIAQQPKEDAEPSQAQEATATPPVEESPVKSEEAEAEPSALQTVDNEIVDMIPVLDSISRAMQQSDSVYAPQDESFFWSALYLIGVNFADQMGRVEITEDGMLKVISQTMQENATACFEDYSDLLDVPDELTGSLTYEESWDAYILVPSDIGDSHSEIMNVTKQDETTLVTVDMVSGDNRETYVFTLVENPYLDSFTMPSFVYSVRNVEKID